jgi:DNA-binding response OmpR family regulator
MNAKVLVVEDDADARTALDAVLSRQGYETAVAEDGDAALVKAAAFKPDVLLCDWQLPGRHDGEAVAREVQSDLDIPVIFVTANSTVDLRRRSRDLRVLAYLSKPVDVARLTAALAAL